jgi:hypothetical protein
MSNEECLSGSELYDLANSLCNELDGRMMAFNSNVGIYKPCIGGENDVYTAMFHVNESFKLLCSVRNKLMELRRIESAGVNVNSGEFSIHQKRQGK